MNTQQRLSRALQHTISEQETLLLVNHLRFVLEQNKNINLTRIDDEERGMVLHIEDSLTALQEIEEAPEGRLVDLGSGGGFPGIPLAIMTGRKTTLVEATKKKGRVLEEFVQKNGLGNQVDVATMRIEELARTTAGRYTVATARALSSLAALMELSAPLLAVDGFLVAYKGNLSDSELNEAKRVEAILGMALHSRREMVLSDGETRREIVVFKKNGPARLLLPRREGQAQHHPL